MPFQPLPEADSNRSALVDLGILVTRVLAVVAFFYYQLRHQLALAIDHLWDGAEWDLVGQIVELGLPVAEVVASASVGLLATALLGTITGFFARLNALVVLAICGFVLLSGLNLSPSLNPQALVLYLAVFAGLACGGAGRLSLDHLLAGRRARRRAGE